MSCKAELRKIVLNAIDAASDSGPREIDGSTDLTSLGIDSLEFTSIIIEIEDQLGGPLSMETLDGFGALSQYTLDAIVGLLSGTIPEAACACESCAPAQHG